MRLQPRGGGEVSDKYAEAIEQVRIACEVLDDEAHIARIEAINAACIDGEITADDTEEGDE